MSTEAPGHSPSPSSGEPAEMFGPYRLEERIGRGGMGEVFRAFDTSRQRTVAVKRLHGGLADDAEYQERFRRESRTAARLTSPHIIPIHDFGTIDDRLYIDMPLISGVDLAKEIERHGRLDPRRAVEIVRQTADALDAAHEDGLIHRDVKPSNVLITQHRGRDFVYLVDFGIVRAMGGDTRSSLTGTGSAIGTLAYMAPELFLGREMDRRVDVYALGCLLFEAIAGRPPFLSEGPGLMYDHLNEAPPKLSEVAPGSPPALDPVLAQAMAKDPAQRFATAGDFADAAVRAVGGEMPASLAASAPPDATVHNVGNGEAGPAGGAAAAGAAAGGAVGAGAAAAAAGQGGGSGTPGVAGPQSATPTYVPGPRQNSGPQAQPWTPGGPSVFGQGGSGPQPGAGQAPGAPGFGPGGYPSGVGRGYGGTGQYPPTMTGGPAGMSGPQNGWYGGPPPPPRTRGAGKVVAIVAGVAVVLLVVVVGAVALLNRGSSSTTATPQTPPGGSGIGTTAPSITSPPPSPGHPALSTVFPDVTSSTCRASTSQDQLTTSTGVNPTEAYICDFSSVAPTARVIYSRWPDATAARAWYQDTVNLGRSLDNNDTWTLNGVDQGPVYTAQGSNGTVYSTGIYDGLPYSWEIRTSTLDQSHTVFYRIRLVPRSSIGG